jgi:hypothetical protein
MLDLSWEKQLFVFFCLGIVHQLSMLSFLLLWMLYTFRNTWILVHIFVWVGRCSGPVMSWDHLFLLHIPYHNSLRGIPVVHLSCSWMFWICHIMGWVWVYLLYGASLNFSSCLDCSDCCVLMVMCIMHTCGPSRYVVKVYTYKPSTSIGHPKLIVFRSDRWHLAFGDNIVLSKLSFLM